MALDDNVALVALVVSLIALFIALGQLAQQLLGTAEGYRRCAKQVIDPWHRLRWRHWIWSEFRYETHFVTPQLYLAAESEAWDVYFDGRCLRDAARDADPTPRFWTWWLRRNRRDAEIQAPRVLSATLKQTEIDRSMAELDAEQVSSEDAEKGATCAIPFGPRLPARRTGSLLRSHNKASWIELLQRLHKVYCVYESASRPEKRVGDHPAAFQPSRSTTSIEHTTKTQVMVKFTEWVWDILPDGVSKPLATTTVGTITVLALRMGMQFASVGERWLAYGNGYSITFQDVPALGLVAKLNRSGGRRDDWPDLIPSRATDKLMCGIIPGNEDLVPVDIHCVGDDRKDETMKAICRAVSAEDEGLFAMWTSKGGRFWETQNEAVALLCEYLPVSMSRCTTHYFWGWQPRRRGVFAFWEASFKFYRHLRREDDRKCLSHEMAKVLRRWRFLEETYRNDFYCLSGCRARDAQDGADQPTRNRKQAQMLHDCRNIFRWTTSWLNHYSFGELDTKSSDGGEKRTVYMRLVAAHIRMSTYAIPEGNAARDANHKAYKPYGNQEKQKHYHLYDRNDAGELIPHNGEPALPVAYEFFNTQLYEIAAAYIKHLNHEEHGIVKQMREITDDAGHNNIDDDVVKTAWWVMMLRGLVWTLSTSHATKGEAIPSSLYDNDTPVWIT